jgi:hypothetical protein
MNNFSARHKQNGDVAWVLRLTGTRGDKSLWCNYAKHIKWCYLWLSPAGKGLWIAECSRPVCLCCWKPKNECQHLLFFLSAMPWSFVEHPPGVKDHARSEGCRDMNLRLSQTKCFCHLFKRRFQKGNWHLHWQCQFQVFYRVSFGFVFSVADTFGLERQCHLVSHFQGIAWKTFGNIFS